MDYPLPGSSDRCRGPFLVYVPVQTNLVRSIETFDKDGLTGDIRYQEVCSRCEKRKVRTL